MEWLAVELTDTVVAARHREAETAARTALAAKDRGLCMVILLRAHQSCIPVYICARKPSSKLRSGRAESASMR